MHVKRGAFFTRTMVVFTSVITSC
uniref:Uncharacterized protein n=1 Tax=Anguilla anguilla TaxID=7936 RepID=A0A0E9QUI5_ANGAN